MATRRGRGATLEKPPRRRKSPSAVSQKKLGTNSASALRMTLDRVHIWKCQEPSTWVTPTPFCPPVRPVHFLTPVTFFPTEPLADVTKGLIDSTAVSGGEFSISVELSVVCSGFWSLNGRLLRSGADYLITRSKSTHTLLIHCVTADMDGTVVKFVGGGSQSSCILSVKGTYRNGIQIWFPMKLPVNEGDDGSLNSNCICSSACQVHQ